MRIVRRAAVIVEVVVVHNRKDMCLVFRGKGIGSQEGLDDVQRGLVGVGVVMWV